MGRGILGTIGLMTTLVFAVPVGMVGLDYLGRGDLLVGSGFLVVASLMVFVADHVTTPADVPGMVVQRVAGAVAEEPDDEDRTEQN